MRYWLYPLLLLVLVFTPGFAKKTEMTMEQYNQALADAMERERVAKESLSQEQVNIEELQRQVREMEGQVAAVRAQMYSFLGITAADVDQFENDMAETRMELFALIDLPGSELVQTENRFENARLRVETLKTNAAAKLARFKPSLADLEKSVDQIAQKLAGAKEEYKEESKDEVYTVLPYHESQDCLWNIAGRYYNDFVKWENIYRANQDKISDPDLIFPGQELEIPQ